MDTFLLDILTVQPSGAGTEIIVIFTSRALRAAIAIKTTYNLSEHENTGVLGRIQGGPVL